MDNGSPWGDAGDQPWTRLTAWLLRLGISISRGRPYHPQTQGKDERFHRTLAAEVLRDRSFTDLVETQGAFDLWRQVYNTQRPHDALRLEVPISRYHISSRAFPESLPPIEYAPDVQVRRASTRGVIKFAARSIRPHQPGLCQRTDWRACNSKVGCLRSVVRSSVPGAVRPQPNRSRWARDFNNAPSPSYSHRMISCDTFVNRRLSLTAACLSPPLVSHRRGRQPRRVWWKVRTRPATTAGAKLQWLVA